MSTRVIALANQKGGVGKTTTAINLSACLTAHRKNILLIDLDPQANATSGLGVDKVEGASIYRALLGQQDVQEVILHTAYKRLDLIPSEVDLAGAEIDVARTDNYLHRLKETLANVVASDHYDYILIDCPPSLGILTMNALTAAHSLIIPIQCEYYALEGLGIMTQLIQKLQRSGANPDLEIEGIVMTMYAGRTNLAQAVVQEVMTHFGTLIYETLIPRTIRLGEAPSFGKPIIAYDKRNVGAVSYLQLAKEFVDRRKKADAAAALAAREASLEQFTNEPPKLSDLAPTPVAEQPATPVVQPEPAVAAPTPQPAAAPAPASVPAQPPAAPTEAAPPTPPVAEQAPEPAAAPDQPPLT